MAEIISGDAMNRQGARPNHSHSTFDLSRRIFMTPRFGVYTPCHIMDCVPDDGPIKHRAIDVTRSYTLKAPLMQDIKLKKDYFLVPMEAILPLNWDKIYVNPVKGDDVDASLVNTVIPDFGTELSRCLSNLSTSVYNELTDDTLVPSSIWRDIFRFLLTFEMFLSEGSLLAHLGTRYSSCVRFYKGSSGVSTPDNRNYFYFDEFFDFICSLVVSQAISTGKNFIVAFAHSNKTYTIKSAFDLREALDAMRDDPSFTISVESGFASSGLYTTLAILFDPGNIVSTISDMPLNYSRCCAYQISCAHFFTNDKVDYIFSANLYREYIYSLLNLEDSERYTFVYNGLYFPYDALSGYYIYKYFHDFLSDDMSSSGWYTCYYPLFSAIFGFNRSLRYQDYFVGAKTQPLAVGDVNVSVNNNLVSVVDVTRNQAKQRFLNNVNRVGQKLEDYIRGIFGNKVAEDWHNPKWLSHTEDVIYAVEVENTAEAQQTQPNSVTALIRGNSSNYEFTIQIDRPCIVIGIEYFDIRRAYTTASDRQTFAVDRFDMFLPDMQFVGDQAVYGAELYPSYGVTPFGYQFRDMQFKQSFDVALGGFVRNLPGYSFVFDYEKYIDTGNSGTLNINPDFIRSKPSELDEFYLSLTGYSMGTYFHFIQKIDNNVIATRPMVAKPNIL